MIIEKKCRVILFNIEQYQNNSIWLDKDINYLFNNHLNIPNKSDGNYKHLCIVSDTDIVEIGDYIIYWNGREYVLTKQGEDKTYMNGIVPNSNRTRVAKLIASTNDTLKQPKPSDSFINKFIINYNHKETIINDIMVDYISIDNTSEIKPKVNPKDNTITIKKVQNNWNKDQIKDLFYKAFTNIGSNTNSIKAEINVNTGLITFYNIDKWLEENL